MRTLTFAAAAAALALAAGSASASVVYQSVPDLSAAPTTNAWCSDCYGGGTFEPLDPFSLSSAVTITGLNLMALDSFGYTAATPFTFEVYDSTHTNILFSQLISPTFVSSNGFGDALITGSVSGLTLAAGNYWAGFIAPVFAVPGYAGGNNGLVDTTPHTGGYLGGDAFALGGNTGYQLLGDSAGVPEPAAWALMIGGFGMAGAMIRRRKAAIA